MRQPRRPAELARLWLEAEETRNLIVTRAHLLAPADWHTLLGATEDRPVALWLVVHEPAVRGEHRAALRETRWETASTDDLRDRLARLPNEPEATQALEEETADYPTVPAAGFPFFVTACGERLDDPQRRCVLRSYFDAADATRRWLEQRQQATSSEILNFLWHLTAPCATASAAITRLRAAQGQLFLAGLLLGVDLDAFAAYHDTRPGAWLSDATATLLRSYAEPRPAALGAIATLTGLGPDALRELDLGHISADARELIGGHPIPERARALIRAQLIARRAEGADQDDALFASADTQQRVSSQALAAQLARISYQTGLQLDRRRGWNADERYAKPWASPAALSPPHTDVSELRERRLALGLSRQQLAEQTGLTTAAIERIENTGDIGYRSPADRIRRALGIAPTTTAMPEAAGDDPSKVEALLADLHEPCTAEGIAAAFGWSLTRASRAIARLDRHLAHRGHTLHRHGHGAYTLAPRTELLDADTRRRAHQTARPRDRERAAPDPRRSARPPLLVQLHNRHGARGDPPPARRGTRHRGRGDAPTNTPHTRDLRAPQQPHRPRKLAIPPRRATRQQPADTTCANAHI